MNTHENNFFRILFKNEGGYVNDPKDSGGETNFGITKAVAVANGYSKPMREMTQDEAKEIYRKEYLSKVKFNEISVYSWRLAYKLADIAVNMGVGRAGEFLQRCLNVLNQGGTYWEDVKVDGDIGNKTLAMLALYFQREESEFILIKAITGLQIAFYIELCEKRPKDERFIKGWLNRADNSHFEIIK